MGFLLSGLVHDIMALNKQELLPWEDNDLINRGYDKLEPTALAMLDSAAAVVPAGDSLHHELRTLYKSNKDLR